MALRRLHAGESEAARAAVRDARLAAAALEKHVRRVEVAEEREVAEAAHDGLRHRLHRASSSPSEILRGVATEQKLCKTRAP